MKLSQTELDNYINIATQQVAANPYYRFGQALWNILPNEVTKDLHGKKELDFFYWTDDNAVMEVVVEHILEK